VSNAPKNPPVIRLPQAALIFIALAAAIGAMLIISNNIDPRATVRAQFTLAPSVTFTPSITPTPVDPFAELTYIDWSSPDELVKMQMPASWEATAASNNGPVAYVFIHPDSVESGMLAAVLPTEQISALASLPEDAAPSDILSALIPSENPDQFAEVTWGDYPAVSFRQSNQDVNQTTGQVVDSQSVMWLVKLAPRHVLLLQALSPTALWDKMEAAFDHMRDSLVIDVPGAIARLDQEFAPAATATAEATDEATAESTAESTAETTAEPTAESAPEATSAATPEPAAPTGTPTPRS
jgi:hypothetical protein